MGKYTPGPWHWINSSTDEPYDFYAQWDGGMPSLRTVAERVIEADANHLIGYSLPKFIVDAEPFL